jgi:hypothetical protein
MIIIIIIIIIIIKNLGNLESLYQKNEKVCRIKF